MHTEVEASLQKPLRLDDFEEDSVLLSSLEDLEAKRPPLAHLEATLDGFPRVRTTLLALRAANIPSMLNLKKSDNPPTFEELGYLLSFLKDWDQLFLQNVLNIFGEYIPEIAKKDLNLEAKIEQKWFQEWLVAAESPKLAGLPWRSYIRKLIAENFNFSQAILRFGHPESKEKDETAMIPAIKEFLIGRKKAVCIFPKNWGKLQ